MVKVGTIDEGDYLLIRLRDDHLVFSIPMVTDFALEDIKFFEKFLVYTLNIQMEKFPRGTKDPFRGGCVI